MASVHSPWQKSSLNGICKKENEKKVKIKLSRQKLVQLSSLDFFLHVIHMVAAFANNDNSSWGCSLNCVNARETKKPIMFVMSNPTITLMPDQIFHQKSVSA